MTKPLKKPVKTELIADRVWRTRSQLELAIVEYLSWFNTGRLHRALADQPPAEFEPMALSSRPVRRNDAPINEDWNHLTRSPRTAGAAHR